MRPGLQFTWRVLAQSASGRARKWEAAGAWSSAELAAWSAWAGSEFRQGQHLRLQSRGGSRKASKAWAPQRAAVLSLARACAGGACWPRHAEGEDRTDYALPESTSAVDKPMFLFSIASGWLPRSAYFVQKQPLPVQAMSARRHKLSDHGQGSLPAYSATRLSVSIRPCASTSVHRFLDRR